MSLELFPFQLKHVKKSKIPSFSHYGFGKLLLNDCLSRKQLIG